MFSCFVVITTLLEKWFTTMRNIFCFSDGALKHTGIYVKKNFIIVFLRKTESCDIIKRLSA